MPVAFGILALGCIMLALAVSGLSFWLINGEIPSNLFLVVAITTFVVSAPLILQSMPTIRNLQRSRDQLKQTSYALADRVDELDEIARVLDESRADLENRVERRTRELEAARSAAVDANKAKSAFLAQMSHELRTPLNAIIGFSEMMYHPGLMTPEKRTANVEEYARIINDSGKHLLSLVGDLLDLSKIEAGKVDLHIERIDLAIIMADVEQVIGPLAKSKNQKLACLIDPGSGALEADRRALMQILLNLLGNAVKYSPPGTNIVVSCTGADDRIAFTVRDEGKGMTADDIQHALVPFARLTNAETTSEAGTGLGLPIVASLIKAQGGHLTFTSEPDVGTEVRFCLPQRVSVDRKAQNKPGRRDRSAVA